jgi:hypothetical protein
MAGLNFSTGVLSLPVNDDPNRIFRFNPSDLSVKNRFFDVYKELKDSDRVKEILNRAGEIDKIEGADENDIPNITKPILEVMQEVDEYYREKIDYCFGEGSSDLLFEDVNIMSFAGGNMIIVNFFEALRPHFEKAANEKVSKHVQKYLPTNRKKRRAAKTEKKT